METLAFQNLTAIDWGILLFFNLPAPSLFVTFTRFLSPAPPCDFDLCQPPGSGSLAVAPHRATQTKPKGIVWSAGHNYCTIKLPKSASTLPNHFENNMSAILSKIFKVQVTEGAEYVPRAARRVIFNSDLLKAAKLCTGDIIAICSADSGKVGFSRLILSRFWLAFWQKYVVGVAWPSLDLPQDSEFSSFTYTTFKFLTHFVLSFAWYLTSSLGFHFFRPYRWPHGWSACSHRTSFWPRGHEVASWTSFTQGCSRSRFHKTTRNSRRWKWLTAHASFIIERQNRSAGWLAQPSRSRTSWYVLPCMIKSFSAFNLFIFLKWKSIWSISPTTRLLSSIMRDNFDVSPFYSLLRVTSPRLVQMKSPMNSLANSISYPWNWPHRYGRYPGILRWRYTQTISPKIVTLPIR